MTLNTPATKGVWGTIGGSTHSCGGTIIEVGNIEPNYGIVLLSSCDGQPLASCKRMILLTAGHSENQDMGWNEERTSVGTNWGKGPTKVTTFDSTTVKLPGGHSWKYWPLDGAGERMTPSPIVVTDGRLTVSPAQPSQRTLWFEIERQ